MYQHKWRYVQYLRQQSIHDTTALVSRRSNRRTHLRLVVKEPRTYLFRRLRRHVVKSASSASLDIFGGSVRKMTRSVLCAFGIEWEVPRLLPPRAVADPRVTAEGSARINSNAFETVSGGTESSSIRYVSNSKLSSGCKAPYPVTILTFEFRQCVSMKTRQTELTCRKSSHPPWTG